MSFGALRFSIIGAAICALTVVDVASAQTFSSEHHEFRVTTVARGLVHPWSLAFLPNGDMLVTERVGRLRIIRNGELRPMPVAGVPEVALGGQGGLLDIALHPKFAENRLIYLSYAAAGEGGSGTEVARARLVDDELVNLERILDVRPKSIGGRHFGSRLLFGRDGYLYVTAGERASRDRAQNLGDLAGSIKILHQCLSSDLSNDRRARAPRKLVLQRRLEPRRRRKGATALL